MLLPIEAAPLIAISAIIPGPRKAEYFDSIPFNSTNESRPIPNMKIKSRAPTMLIAIAPLSAMAFFISLRQIVWISSIIFNPVAGNLKVHILQSSISFFQAIRDANNFYASVVNNCYSIAKEISLLYVMGCQNNSNFFNIPQVLNVLKNFPSGKRVKAKRWLVKKQHLWMMEHSPCNFQPAFH